MRKLCGALLLGMVGVIAAMPVSGQVEKANVKIDGMV